MKILGILLFAALPASAQEMMGPTGCSGNNHATAMMAVYALLGVVGYWVLQHAAKNKEAEKYVKRTGHIVAWCLLGISLLGTACALSSHIGRNARNRCMGPGEMGRMDMRMMGVPGKFQRDMPGDMMTDEDRPPLRDSDEKPPLLPKKK